MDFLGIGWGELLLILVVAIIVMGPAKVVETGRTLGKIVRGLKRMGSDFTNQITREIEADHPSPPKIIKMTEVNTPVDTASSQPNITKNSPGTGEGQENG